LKRGEGGKCSRTPGGKRTIEINNTNGRKKKRKGWDEKNVPSWRTGKKKKTQKNDQLPKKKTKSERK